MEKERWGGERTCAYLQHQKQLSSLRRCGSPRLKLIPWSMVGVWTTRAGRKQKKRWCFQKDAGEEREGEGNGARSGAAIGTLTMGLGSAAEPGIGCWALRLTLEAEAMDIEVVGCGCGCSESLSSS